MNKVSFLGAIMRIIACTPNKNFDIDLYNKQVIEPSKEMRKLLEEIDDTELSFVQKERIFQTLKEILKTKMLDTLEITSILEKLAREYDLTKIFNTTEVEQ